MPDEALLNSTRSLSANSASLLVDTKCHHTLMRDWQQIWHYDMTWPSCFSTGHIKCLCRVLCSGCWVEPLFMAAMGCSLGLCNLSARLSSPGAAPRGLCCTLPRARPPPRRGSVETRGRSVTQRRRHRGDQCVARVISAIKPTLHSRDILLHVSKQNDFLFLK